MVSMQSPRPSQIPSATLAAGGHAYTIVDLPGPFGADYAPLPVVLRLLLENALRNMQGQERDTDVDALFAWLHTGPSEAELPFQPGRGPITTTPTRPEERHGGKEEVN